MIVALLVVGPERLPGLARKAGLWLGKAKRFMSSVKEDIDRELAAEELKRIIEEQKKSTGLHEIIEETKDTIDEARDEYLLKSVDDTKKELEQETKSIKQAVDSSDNDDRPAKQ